MTEDVTLLAGIERADRLIGWMSKYIGQMSPGKYSDCFADLNEHGLFMDRLRRDGLLPADPLPSSPQDR